MVRISATLIFIDLCFHARAIRRLAEDLTAFDGESGIALPPDDDVHLLRSCDPTAGCKRRPFRPREGAEGRLNLALRHLAAAFNDERAHRLLARELSFRGDWPRLYGEGEGEGVADVKAEVARIVALARIALLQAARGLAEGRLGEELAEWFGSAGGAAREYAAELLFRMHAVCANLVLQYEPLEGRALWARAAGGCARPAYELSAAGFVLRAGAGLLGARRNVLEAARLRRTLPGLLLHEVSHITKDEALTLRQKEHWKGDMPGSSCGDDGRLGTVDYRLCAGPGYEEPCRDLAVTRSRDARHNADNVRLFVEASMLAEQRLGKAMYLMADGRIGGLEKIDTAAGPPLTNWFVSESEEVNGEDAEEGGQPRRAAARGLPALLSALLLPRLWP